MEVGISVGGSRSGLRIRHRRHFFHRKDADELSVSALVFEADHARDERKQRIILRAADVLPRLIARSALANQNAAAGHNLTPESLDTEALPVRVASVCGRPAALFMCHDNLYAIWMSLKIGRASCR